MTSYDVKRDLKHCYAPKNKRWAVVDVPSQQFIGIAGSGNPNTSSEYRAAVEALYAVAYTIKFTSKKALDRDFVVGPLEGLWWADDPTVFIDRDKDSWQWRLLITQPEWITPQMIEVAKRSAYGKKANAAISDVHHETLDEGRCAQVLHIGSYDDEAPLLAALHHEWLPSNGYDFAGLHHEIYLSDPRRTEPAKLRTILRQPIHQSRTQR